uniref:hypothetical protein n=1 Tax=Pseudomonas syringae TaxID=317 RepID=UPI00359C4586
MKKNVIAYALSAFMLTAALPAAHAVVPGVPVLDPSTLLTLRANALAQAKQAMDALTTAKDAIRETAQQYNHYKSIITGNDMLGGFLIGQGRHPRDRAAVQPLQEHHHRQRHVGWVPERSRLEPGDAHGGLGRCLRHGTGHRQFA